MDPHAENYLHASPYSYVENNPISRIDPDGRDWYEHEGNYQWRRSQDETYTDDDGNEWKNSGTSHMVGRGDTRIIFDQHTNDDGELVLTSMSFENMMPSGGGIESTSISDPIFGLLADGLSEGLQALGMKQGSANITAGATVLAGSLLLGRPKLRYPKGSFSVSNWAGYPKGGVKPSGPFRLLEGSDYTTARNLANSTNAAMRRANPSQYKGLQIHEIHPVKFGGSPTSLSNKIILTPSEHAQYNRFWNNMMRNINKAP